MGEVVKLPGSVMTADEVLEAEKGTYSKVVLMGVTHDDKVYISTGGNLTNQDVVFLCELLKMDVLNSEGLLVQGGL